jgi:hypothetical protein
MSGRNSVVALIVAVLICGLVGLGCRGEQSIVVEPDVPSLPGPSAASAAAAAVTVGNPDAPVKLMAFYPLNEGHQFIADYVQEFAEAHSEHVYLEVIDFRTSEGMVVWQDTGLSCAGVLVNGTTVHEIERDGEIETVNFIKRLGVNWTKEDFETVVNQLLAEAGVALEAAAGETDDAPQGEG